MISYTRYRRERFSFQKILLVVILLLFCLLPLLFLYPGVSLQLQPTDTPWLPTYRIDVDTLLPVSSVYAEVDGARLLVAAAGENTYIVEPRANGTLSVTVTLINNQYQTVTVPVSDVDTEAPACSSHSQKDGKVWLTLEDSGSGVDYSSITALDQVAVRRAPSGGRGRTDGCILLPGAFSGRLRPRSGRQYAAPSHYHEIGKDFPL